MRPGRSRRPLGKRPPRAGAGRDFIARYTRTYRFSLGFPRAIHVTRSGDAVLFLRSGPRSFVRDLYEFDPRTGQERTLLTAEDLLSGQEEVLTADEKARRERLRLAARGIADYSVSEDGQSILVPLSGRLFVVERASRRVKELSGVPGYAMTPRLSPDGSRVAAVVDGDLYVTDVASGRERRLTRKTDPHVTYGLAEFAAQEEMGRGMGFWWSPDGRAIAYQKTDTSGVPRFHVADPLDPAKPPQSWPYPRAGTANAVVELGVVSVDGGEAVWVEWDRPRYPYLARVVWERGGPLTILVQDRRQQEELLLAVDAATGKTSELLSERDDAWLNIDSEMPHWLEDGSGFLWTTERRGSWQLELRSPNGSLERDLTPPGFGYRALADADPEIGVVHVIAGEDPTESHLYRLSLHSDANERITTAPGLHAAVFSDGHRVHALTRYSPEGNRTTEVFDRERGRVGNLRDVAEAPPFSPNAQWLRVGERDFRAVVIRPRDFQSGRRYPVIVHVYGGPGIQTVTRNGR